MTRKIKELSPNRGRINGVNSSSKANEDILGSFLTDSKEKGPWEGSAR
jgi:hypothetical protein